MLTRVQPFRNRKRLSYGQLGILGMVLPLVLGGIGRATLLPTFGKQAPTAPHDLAEYTTKIEDLEAALRVTKLEPKELEKIGKDFATTYRLRNLTFQYKQPNKLRLVGKSPLLGTALLILNGQTRFYSIPKLGLHKVEDLANSPSKRQSLLEYSGLLSSETLRFMQSKFLRAETLNGNATEVYELKFQGSENASSYRVWIDPKMRLVLKREWYDMEGHLKATFTYQEPQEVAPGVWLPSQIEVKNSEGTVAATTTYSNVKINQGLADTLFAINKN